jgi:hypothetical protein
MSRRRMDALAVVLTMAALGGALLTPGRALEAQDDDPPPADSASRRVETRAEHYGIIAAGALSAATFNQGVGLPDKWPRTWRGYGYRLGDQAGFAVAEESLRAAIGVVVPWRSDFTPCPKARAGHAFGTRVRSATGCAVRSTFVARTPRGDARANVPLLGAIVGASAVSLAWRPEREDATKAQVFVASRIGIVLGGTVANRAWEAWRGNE